MTRFKKHASAQDSYIVESSKGSNACHWPNCQVIC
uniref:Uncharacterized protein n=1 Tax=Rhizophora mucronata TaxID=61149 RepID=A0A2P2PYP7_RHIMU